jgi:hypothetical protein
VVFFFFQKKKQKALFRFAERCGCPKPRRNRPWGLRACPQQNSTLSGFLLFHSTKRSKKCCSASRKDVDAQSLGEADPGCLGACPQQNSTLSGFLPFPEKEAKCVCSASQKITLPNSRRSRSNYLWAIYTKTRRGRPRWIGACPAPRNQLTYISYQSV